MIHQPDEPEFVRIMLHIGTRRLPLNLPCDQRLLIGRLDEDSTTTLGLDLAPFDGEANGVSRIHAAFSVQDGLAHLEDLESTNGTRINGLTLIPNQPYRLRDGDELEFGSARLTFRLPKT